MNIEPKNFYSNGKLLLSGEYVVLDGAIALAVPTKLGQSLKVELTEEPKINWRSLDENGKVWFEDEFLIEDILSNTSKSQNDVSNRLTQILHETMKLNPEFLSTSKGYKITTQLDFPRNWGLGTSSTLINTIASWANVDAYQLLSKTFGGSGYDIACTQHDVPVIYQLKSTSREVKEVAFNPPFKENLYFVFLNKKQNSRDAIAHYKSNTADISSEISSINKITLELIDCKNLAEFNRLIESHEQLISKITKQRPIKDMLFSDFEGSIKSLGAWGGDFILVTSKENPSDYFKSIGFNIIMPYQKLIK